MERTDPRAIGYCPECKRPFKWHKNDFDFSATRGIMPMWRCQSGHDNPLTLKKCGCGLDPQETACVYMDGSRPGYAWGMASRKPAREYATGARVENEICGYQNPGYPGYPCLRKRGHDEESELGVQHDHGEIPYTPPIQDRFPTFKKNDAGIFVES